MKLIDPHVHLRDWNQAAKETIVHGFAVAWRAGVSALFEMPNTAPTITDRKAVEKRIADGDAARAALPDVTGEAASAGLFHGMYVGLTDDLDQVREAVAVHGERFPRVVGFKLYAGHSTGRMGVTAAASQFAVWRTLSECDYRGVVAVHAEREELLRPDLWDPLRPESHSEARPTVAEIASVQTQIDLAEAAGFRGTLHICHISVPDTVEIIVRERDGLPFRLTGATTPHHALLDTDLVRSATRRAREDAARADTPGTPPAEFNVNPPLREPALRTALYDRLTARDLDWIESDHAPHTWAEKEGGASGLPGLAAFRLLAEDLRRALPAASHARLTGQAVLETFAVDDALIGENPHAETPWPDPDENPEAFRALWRPLAAEYPWDPYRHLVTNGE
ncbi:MAG: dihydroorotase [Spirochaetales bacterium]|nr:dihydroorotase [Spirochaetales bacterium]